MINRSAQRNLFAALQVLTACTTLLLLTATVMHRADEDGFQGAHLFFTPRHNWEMDEGRGMLHDEEYYREVDEQEMLLEGYGWDADLSEGHEDEEPAIFTSSRPDEGEGPYHQHTTALSRAPHPRAFFANDMPSVRTYEAYLPYSDLVFMSIEPLAFPVAWQPDIQSPPPRASRCPHIRA